MPPRIICIGAGGHASVLVDALRTTGDDVIGYLDASPSKHGTSLLDQFVLGPVDLLDDPASLHADAFVIGVSSTGPIRYREQLFGRCVRAGLEPYTVVHASAAIAKSARVEPGCALLAGSVVQPNVHLCGNVIVNSRAVVSHDARVGAHSHIAPGAILLGETKIGERTHIGAGASVRQGITIGSDATVAMGAVVVRHVPDGVTVLGVPARPLEDRSESD